MAEPVLPTKTIVSRLFSLKTPIAERLLEFALLLALAYGAAWVYEHGPETVKFFAMFMVIMLFLVGFAMVVLLFATVIRGIESVNPRSPAAKDDSQPKPTASPE